MAKEYANFSQLDDPWDLPPYFLLRKDKWMSLRTHSGYWKEKQEDLTAIRSAGESSQSPCSASPSYVGVRKTLEFYLNDGTRGGEGTRTDWICHEYLHLRKNDAGEALFLQEDVVLRKVFNKCKSKTDQQSSSLYSQVESCVKAYNEQLKQGRRSHRDNYGNKPGIILRMEAAHFQDISSSLVRPYTVGLLPGFPFFGVPLPNGAVRESFCSRFSVKEAPTPPETSLLRSTSKDSLELVLARVHSIAQSLENRKISASYADHTFQTVMSSLLTAIEQKIECRMRSVSEHNEDLGVDCDPNALNHLLTTIEQKIKSWMHLVSAKNKDLGVFLEKGKDLGVDCDPDGKSDNVWKHFTKIRSANDPDEVFAACHRCDKVLKAHPKKHGTSHLKRHIHTCSSCTNPSTDEDRAMLHRLRTALDEPYEQQKVDSQEDLTQLDPWDLNLTQPTLCYFTGWLNRNMKGGHWKEINKEFTAIRMDQQVCWKDIIDKAITMIQMDHLLQEQVPLQPQYIGLRRTLQFHHQDGSKEDWIMHEYQQLDNIEASTTLLLQGCMVIRKVFRYDKDAVSSAFSDIEKRLNADDGDEEYFNGDGVNTDITTPSDCMDSPCSVFPVSEGTSSNTTTPSCGSVDTPVDRKRKRVGAASNRKSEVWLHFTKIHNTDCAVVYVVCHTCDRGYTSGDSKNGTSHLRRHTKSCARKHPNIRNAKDATAEWETEIWPRLLPNLQELWRNRASGMLSS